MVSPAGSRCCCGTCAKPGVTSRLHPHSWLLGSPGARAGSVPTGPHDAGTGSPQPLTCPQICPHSPSRRNLSQWQQQAWKFRKVISGQHSLEVWHPCQAPCAPSEELAAGQTAPSQECPWGRQPLTCCNRSHDHPHDTSFLILNGQSRFKHHRQPCCILVPSLLQPPPFFFFFLLSQRFPGVHPHRNHLYFFFCGLIFGYFHTTGLTLQKFHSCWNI